MKCPRDKRVLLQNIPESGVNKCPECEGLFIENQALSQRVLEYALPKKKINYLNVPVFECPRCLSLMDEFILNGIDFENCKKCNAIWFDFGESEKVGQRLTPEEMEKIKAQVTKAREEDASELFLEILRHLLRLLR